MSLVNDMLNDLDDRRNQGSRDEINLDWLAGQKPTKKRNAYRWALLIIVVLVALVLVAVVARIYNPDETVTRVDEMLAGKQLKQEFVNSVNKQTNSRQLVSAVQFSKQNGGVTASFDFNADIIYKVIRDPAGLELQFFDSGHQFDSAQLKALPPIRSVSVQNRSNAVVVTLTIEGDFNYSSQSKQHPEFGLEIGVSPIIAESKDVKPLAVVPLQSKAQPTSAKLTKLTKPPIFSPKSDSENRISEFRKSLPVNLKQQDIQVAKNARRLIDANQLVKAEQALRDMLFQQPLALNSGEVLATLLLAQQRLEETESLLNRLRAEFPTHVGLIAIQGRLLLVRGDSAKAVDTLMKARPSVQSNPEYYELLGLAARQNQQYLLSEQVYKGLLDVDAGQGDWWVGLGIALDAQGKIAEARKAYKQALKTGRVSQSLANYARQRLSN